MGSWRVETELWPLVIHAVEGALTNTQVDAYILAATEVLRQGGPQVVILDATNISSFTAYTRSRATQFQRENAGLLRANCVGSVYVLSSPLLRFVAMTVLLVTRLPTPLHVCETREQALAWGRKRLAEAAASTG